MMWTSAVNRRFETTRWSAVLAAQDSSTAVVREALATLCETYWGPLYGFVRRQGHGVEEAEDLTQGYFALLLEKDYLQGVDASKGRLRSFLLVSVKHFLANEWDKKRALKRGGDLQKVPLDRESAESRFREHAADELTPEEVFERHWALTVLELALAELEREAETAGKKRKFERLKPYLVGGEPSVPYKEVGNELQMSPGAVKTAVYRMRQRFGHLLRNEIAETLASGADVEAELRHLLGVLAR